ncbi:MAG: hypothetical protein LH478_14445, partial [Chitinophagaceae bacterium]|nr:hypothetical protein [Chitinophagaceae bacterium]
STNANGTIGEADTLEIETIGFLQTDAPAWANIRPSAVRPGKFMYSYTVQSAAVQFINLVYGDKIIMRYRLNISKPFLTVAE